MVEVARIEKSLSDFGNQFLGRVFTEHEQIYCQQQRRSALHLAARFAAKEAVSKAFGTGIGKEMGWLDIEVKRKESGEPGILLHGGAHSLAAQQGVIDIKISLTHTEHYAAANAVLLGAG